LLCLHEGQNKLSYFRKQPHKTRYISKMLYLIGLGLSDETDITVRGLEIVRKASRVYLEAYTSILLVDKNVLVRYFANARPSRG
jgi:hypothetical protein